MGASITMQRRLEWPDTDAAGYWHHSTLWRFAEAAEAELHRRLGITKLTFGFTPRRHLEAEFFGPLYFDDLVTITCDVERVGGTSMTQRITLESPRGRAAVATMVVVLIGDDGRPRTWPEDAAAALRGEIDEVPAPY